MTSVPFDSKQPSIVVTRRLPQPVEARLRELFSATLNDQDQAFTRDQLLVAVQNAQVLVPTVTDALTADVLEQAGPQLKLIANFGAGVDHIDLQAAARKGIIVTNTPSVLTEDTADIAMGLIIAAPRRLSEAASLVRKGEWTGWTPTFMMGHRVNGKKLGIIGLGRIGQAIARRAKGFGMDVLYHNRKPVHEQVAQSLGVEYRDNLDAMLAEVDILSISCPYTPQTHHLINAERLAQMKSEAYLVNTARGAVVDEQALIVALQNGTISGAGLDVFEKEPYVPEALRKLNNVVLLPHISSATLEGRTQMGEKVLINIKSFVDGHQPPDRVLIQDAA